MKRYSKLLSIAFLSFFVSISSVFAKEVTLSELGKEVEKLQPSASYVYVIGNYAFTSKHILTTQDVMISARSIEATSADGYTNEDNLYKKMNIHKIKRTYKDFKPIGWQTDENVLGSTKLELDETKKINIRYIDYKFIPEVSKATIDINKPTSEEYQSNLKDILKFEGGNGTHSENLNYDSSTGKLTGHILKYDGMDETVFSGEDKTGYYFAFVVEVPNASEKTTVKLVGTKNTTNATFDNFDIKNENGKTPGLLVLWSVDPSSVNDKKKIEVKVDLDGEEKEYEETTYTIDYSQLTFQGESKADITTTIPENDSKGLFNWGYNVPTNEYSLSLNGKILKLNGKVIEQHTNKDVFTSDENGEDGYYFAYNLKPELIEDNIKITIPDGKGKTKEFTKSNFDNDTSITILHKLNENCNKTSESAVDSSDENACKFDITIDLDGANGTKYVSTTYTIDYSDVTFVKNSKFELESIEKESNAESKLQSNLGWIKKEGYQTTFKVDEEKPYFVNVAGLIPVLEEFSDNKQPFEGEDITNYYLAYVIKTSKQKKDEEPNRTTVKFVHEGEEEKIITATDFDGNNELYVLKHIDPNDPKKTFDVVVDMDGEGEEYAPYTLTVDYSQLKFQNESTSTDVKVAIRDAEEGTAGYISQTDKNEYNGYNFDWDKDSVNITSNTESSKSYDYNLNGTVKEQHLKEGTFKDSDGYFVPVKIYAPNLENLLLTDEEKTSLKDKWTVILNTEFGETKNVTPSSDDYKNGFITVLFKISNEGNKQISYQIDFDGSGNLFAPHKEIIDYSNLIFLEERKITFDFGEGKENKEVIAYEGDKINAPEELPTTSDSYHEFKSWVKDDNTEFDFTKETIGKDDITLKPHWVVDADKFVEDVVNDLNSTDETSKSQDFSEKFVLDFDAEKNSISIDVLDNTVLLSELANTSIPGSIAYALEKGEIKEITLTSENQSVRFNLDGVISEISAPSTVAEETLKEKVVKGAKTLFTTILGGEEQEKTKKLSEMNGKNFTLAISQVSENVELKDSTNLLYTFEINSDASVVDTEEELKQAIEAGQDKILVADNIELSDTITINNSNTITIETLNTIESSSIEDEVLANSIRIVTIAEEILGGNHHKTISLKNEDGNVQKSIFDVTNGNITFKNLNIKGNSATAIIVENQATVTADTVDFSGCVGLPVEVKGTFNGINLTYESESYDNPIVKVLKDSKTTAKVDVKGASKVEDYIKVTKHDKKWCNAQEINSRTKIDDCESGKKSSLSDEYETTNDTYYYLNSSNAKKYYIILFMDERRTTIIRLVESGKPIDLPQNFDEEYKPIGYTSTDGKKYKFAGWKSSGSKDVITDWSKEISNKSSQIYFAVYVEDTSENIE